ncbi:MAG: RNA polymerase sigma-70 factor [Anaerolineae bacterium]|nr:RNA polymerase sigma-70 factor [Anaerolineae bacterium]
MSARLDHFDEYRPLLFGIAYRMLGSVMDAEDMVQEAFLRWQHAPEGEVHSPKAYLVTVVTRLCLDHLKSARGRREEYIGPWLPEPLVTEGRQEVAEAAMLSESLSMAFLVMLESLTPTERAVFLLHEVFDYEYREIAAILDKTEEAVRQMAHRARGHVQSRRPRFHASREQTQRAVLRFSETLATGDMTGLLAILAPDVTVWSDGGGKVAAARNPVQGQDHAARFLLGLVRKAPRGFTPRLAEINGQPGIIGYVAGQPFLALLLDVAEDQITGVRFVLNPDKLRSLPTEPV